LKGIIFNLLEKVVTQRYGEDAWDDLDGSTRSLPVGKMPMPRVTRGLVR
jgi:hypothetical protein